MSWQEARLGQEYIWLERASRLSAFSPEQAAAFQRAYDHEPRNYQTTYNIGESFRMRSFEGGTNYAELAEEAMGWFKKGIKLNPYDGYNYMRFGMCLDWTDRHEEAGTYFGRADELDPNGYYTTAHVGWHYVQIGDYAAAREWFERSQLLYLSNNEIAPPYLLICERKLLEKASNKASPLAR